MTRFRNPLCSVAAPLAVLAVAVVSTAVPGCAASSASRAQREVDVDQSDMRRAAQDLSSQIAASPQWKRFVDRVRRENPNTQDLVILLDEFQNRTGKLTWDVARHDDFFVKLETDFAKNDIGTFAQSVEPDAPNYWKAGERARRQDFDKRYNQKTGRVFAEGLSKADVLMKIDVCRQEVPVDGRSVPTETQYELRARLMDAVTGTIICSPAFPITK